MEMVGVERPGSRLPIPAQSYCIAWFMMIYRGAATDLNVYLKYEMERTRNGGDGQGGQSYLNI